MPEQIFPEGFAEKIGQIMANPALLQTVSSLLPLISAAVKPPPPQEGEIVLDLPKDSEPEPPSAPEPASADFTALLAALRPFLSPERQAKLDRISLLAGVLMSGQTGGGGR